MRMEYGDDGDNGNGEDIWIFRNSERERLGRQNNDDDDDDAVVEATVVYLFCFLFMVLGTAQGNK